MAPPDRRVHHLRLAARTESDVRSMLPCLEDAMRCGNLPDSGEQLLLVRKLALGHLPHDASSQTLALILERRVAAAGGTWAEGGSWAAEVADFIYFASRFDARLKLALRLARGETTDAWYWHLAVPEYQPQVNRAENLRHIALALAELPEARVALPAWCDTLVRARLGTALRAAVPASLAQELTERIGRSDLPGFGPAAKPSHSDDQALTELPGATTMTSEPRPAYERKIDIATRHHPQAPSRQLGERQPTAETDCQTQVDDAGTLASAEHAHPDSTSEIQRYAPDHPGIGEPLPDIRLLREENTPWHAPVPMAAPNLVTTEPAPPRARTKAEQGLQTDATTSFKRPARKQHGEMVHAGADATKDADTSAMDTNRLAARLWLAPTTAGGLLFLLPLLARLNIACWAEKSNRASETFAWRVLAKAMTYLDVVSDDPLWSLLSPLPKRQRRLASAAPAIWSDLPPPRGRPHADLAAALTRCCNIDEQASIWLTACRRWLRRHGIGLASLALRPARLAATPTHIDLYFRLDATDIRVRRLGLDIDPGWLPWFGRVVSFHYDLGATE